MHDAVARWNNIYVLKGSSCPIDEVETVIVAAIFNRSVLVKSVAFKAGMFNGQGVIDNQLCRHYRVHFRRITTFGRDGIS